MKQRDNRIIPDWSQFDPLLREAMDEDAVREDVTTRALIREGSGAEAAIMAKQEGVICGLGLLLRLCTILPGDLNCMPAMQDGDCVYPGSNVALIAGPADVLLGMERTALNFLQRLSGIASLTRQYVDAVAGSGVAILDTRKTTPGWRKLEKYAVSCGGGKNHRMNLSDQVLVKENHLLMIARDLGLDGPGAVDSAVRTIRKKAPGITLAIEIEDMPQLRAALTGRPDIVLLDNMTPADIQRSIDLIDDICSADNTKRPLVEVSGGISLDNVRSYAMPGVDRISIGALTHSAPALDLAMTIGPGRIGADGA